MKVIGHTTASMEPGCSKGTFVYRSQGPEYKLSNLQRQSAGIMGSATFPHGAIGMWN